MVSQYKQRSTDSLVRIERKFNNTFIYFSDGLIECVEHEIDELEKDLKDLDFWRVHPNHLINPSYFNKVISTTSKRIVLKDGTELPVFKNMVKRKRWNNWVGNTLGQRFKRIFKKNKKGNTLA
ncbi:LytTR family transcriptional regulator DNA-binding domain-containing protein [Bacteroidota bacterium]